MNSDSDRQLAALAAREEIRELVMLYARGVDRKDGALLRSLYTGDATDTHGDAFDGSGDEFVDFLESNFNYLRYSGHHICNHLISVAGDSAEGEVYAIAWHILPDGDSGWVEELMCVRYIDRYRREADGRWRFARRVVTFDLHSRRPSKLHDAEHSFDGEPSYSVLKSRLFRPGPRC